ncbi:hypothetical protein ACJMK2_000565 [Sinanodonta woodiana]|uniref:NmrA-like domain-containing protein n=2 Tax=Sinanodonta woodiana TaxID=1069815 RepID=A0ABD3XPS9_SINWO
MPNHIGSRTYLKLAQEIAKLPHNSHWSLIFPYDYFLITALGQSLKLAQEIAKFPQQCMNVDRKFAYYSTFDAESWDAAMQYEFMNGMKVIQDEAVPGAASFVKGIGKHGSFNINKPSKL